MYSNTIHKNRLLKTNVLDFFEISLEFTKLDCRFIISVRLVGMTLLSFIFYKRTSIIVQGTCACTTAGHAKPHA